MLLEEQKIEEEQLLRLKVEEGKKNLQNHSRTKLDLYSQLSAVYS